MGDTEYESVSNGLMNRKSTNKRIGMYKKVPLTLILRIRPSEYRAKSISHLQNIVIYIAKQTTLQEVNSAPYEIYDHGGEYIVVYAPANYENPILVNKEQLLDIWHNFKIEKYYGFRFVSDNPLVYYAVDIYHRNIRPLSLSQIYVHNSAVFVQGNDDLVAEIGSLTDKLAQEGYFNIRNNGLVEKKYVDSVHAAAYLEIAMLWNLEIISYINPVIVKSTSQTFGQFFSTKTWLIKAAKEVIRGLLPIYTLKLPYQSESYYLDRYRSLYKAYPYLKKYENELKVMPVPADDDYFFVTARFGSSKQVQYYYTLVEDNSINVTKTNLEIKPTTGEFWILHRGPMNTSVLGMVLKSDHFVKIPTYQNFLNTHQLPNTLYARYIPYKTERNINKNSMKKLNQKWLNGELISDWGKQILLDTGKISRFSLALNKSEQSI